MLSYPNPPPLAGEGWGERNYRNSTAMLRVNPKQYVSLFTICDTSCDRNGPALSTGSNLMRHNPDELEDKKQRRAQIDCLGC